MDRPPRPTRTCAAARRAVLATAALALLAGCAGGPYRAEPPRAEPLPALQPGAGTTLADLSIRRWWLLLDDAELTRTIDDALVHNADLKVAAARLREAQAHWREVHAARGVDVTLQGSSARSRSAAEALPPGAPREGSSHGAAIAASFDLDLWGRLAAADDAARARLAAEGWARTAVAWSLTAQVAQAHVSLRTVMRQLAIADAVRAGRLATAQLRQRERAAGSGSEFELRRAEAELAQADAQLAALQRQRSALEGTLMLLAGRHAAQVTAEVPALAPLAMAAPQPVPLPQGDAGAMLLERPDVQRAERTLAALQADVAAARAATLPAVRLSGRLGSDARELSQLFSGPAFVWSLVAGVTQSVFDGGAAQARVDQAQARRDAALAEYRRAVAGAVIDLRDAYAALATTERALEAGQRRVEALERTRRLAQAGVAAGVLTRLDLLDAERASFQAQLDAADAARDRVLAQVAAYKALGGGTAGTAPT